MRQSFVAVRGREGRKTKYVELFTSLPSCVFPSLCSTDYHALQFTSEGANVEWASLKVEKEKGRKLVFRLEEGEYIIGQLVFRVKPPEEGSYAYVRQLLTSERCKFIKCLKQRKFIYEVGTNMSYYWSATMAELTIREEQTYSAMFIPQGFRIVLT